MSWGSGPPTVVVGDVIAAATGNLYRDLFLETAPAKATSPGQLFVATGAGAIAAIPVGSAGQVLQVSGGTPAWGALPSVKRCRVYRATNQSLAASSDQMLWDGEVYDPSGWHSLVTNTDRITVDTDGVYLLHAQIGYAAGAGARRGCSLTHLNAAGSVQRGTQSYYANISGSNPTAESSLLVVASATDYFTVQSYQDSGGSLNTTGTDQWCYFEVVLLGPQ